MAYNAPGKHHRKGISLAKFFDMFPDNEAAEAWFVKERWPEGPHCPHCGSLRVLSGAKHKTMPYRCREKECRKRFSVRTGTCMEASNLGFQVWLIAIYLMTTNLKGVSSMKLHRDLEITQKSAWYLAMRLRKALEDDGFRLPFLGPVEADETYMGGLEQNKHASKKLKAGRGGVGKTAVAGAKDRESNRVAAKVVPDTKSVTLQDYLLEVSDKDALLYTDDNAAYRGIDRRHETVRHSAGEYVHGRVHTNGMEGFWAMLKRAHKGVYHKMSKKHLDRYVSEFVGRHNVKDADTEDQMRALVCGMEGKRLRYADLKADNGLPSGARS